MADIFISYARANRADVERVASALVSQGYSVWWDDSDARLRGLLYEAATVILTRTCAESGLRVWGLKLREKLGFKRAAVAVARKPAVIMHAMLKSGAAFDRSVGLSA